MRIILRYILNIFIPEKCYLCDSTEIYTNQGGICSKCWSEIKFISYPYCYQCGMPMDQENIEELKENQCMKCSINNDNLLTIRSVCIYNDNSSSIITKMKYGDQIQYAKFIATMMFTKYQQYIEDNDYICYVPMTRRRRFKRMFNQSAVIAKYIANLSKKKLIIGLLKKKKETPQQASLTMKQRERNLLGSIRLNKEYKHMFKNKNILLVDDVTTTKSTLNECAKELKKTGANVRAIVFGCTKI